MDKNHKTMQIGINGMGIIGRLVYRMLVDMEKNRFRTAGSSKVKVVKVNDLTPKENLEYLLKHDTVHGRWEEK